MLTISYFGWYGGLPNEMGKWADDIHRQLPGKPVGISEYGAGASIFAVFRTFFATPM